MTGETSEVLVDARGLAVGHGGVPSVRGLDLVVAAGEVVALLGANGAGKTTTLLTLSGLLAPLDGTVSVLGRTTAPGRRPSSAGVWSLARRGVAHVPEDRALFADLTVGENLRLGRRRSRPGVDLDVVLGWFPALAPLLGRRAGLCSGGEQQQLALARAVVGGPRVLLIDEFSQGLAPQVARGLLPVVRTIADETGAGVLLVDQHVDRALAVADRAVLLSGGACTWSGPAADLAARRDVIERGYLGDRRR